jgi:multisubunit Na+/H+ antiporter MnhB subunit
MARYQPPGGRGRQPSGMLPARRQLPPPEPAVRQRALAALLLGALSLIGLMLGLGNLRRGIYVAVLALLFAAAAVWLGVTASKMARRSGTARPRWAVGGVVLGGIGLAFSVLWLLLLAVFWSQLSTYYGCMGGANTVTAQQACHKQFSDSVGSELSLLQNGRLRLLVGGGPRVEVDPVAVRVVGLVHHAGERGRDRRGGL